MNKKLLANIVILIGFCIFIAIPSNAFGQISPLSIKIEKIDDQTFPNNKVIISVSDAQGFPIEDLQSNNFKLSEDGKTVATFSVTPFQNFQQPLAIILIMDTSGSMQGKPLENSIAAAMQFNTSLAAQDVLGLVTFATEVTVAQVPTTNRGAVETKLATLKAEGATALNDALVEAVGMLKNRSERRVVVLLTDGKQEGTSKYSSNDVVNEAVRWSTPIYTIGFGNVDKNQLEQFAQLTGGFAQINPDSSTVGAAFQSVLTILREQYAIEYVSSLTADGLEHPLEVSVEYQNGFAAATRTFVARPGQVSVKLLEPVLDGPLGGTVRIVVEGLAPATIRQVDISLDGQPLTSIQNAPYEYLWDSTSFQPGEYSLGILVSDQAGNLGQETYDIEVRAPVVVEVGLDVNERVGGETTIPVSVDSIARIAKVVCFIDSTQVSELTSPPFTFVWDTRQFKPGPHMVRVEAQDVNGTPGEASVPLIVVLQRNNNLIWIILIMILVAGGIMVPLSLRTRRMFSKTIPAESNAYEELVTRLPGENALKYTLIEIAGMNPGQEWPLSSGQTRLGRKRSESDIPLQGLSASRNHAIIDVGPDGCQITVIHSHNPIYINGKTVSKAVLNPGDLIEAGESSFRFEVKE